MKALGSILGRGGTTKVGCSDRGGVEAVSVRRRLDDEEK